MYRDITGRLNMVRKDGRELRLALPDGLQVTGDVSACGNGRYVVFAAVPGHNIWRVSPGTGGAVQLTTGSADHNPKCSADGNWIVYTSLRGDLLSTWLVPIDGGEPAPLIEGGSWGPLPSPRGSKIVYATFEWEEQPVLLRHLRLIVISAADRRRIHTLDAPADQTRGVPITWAPDESGLDYVVTRRGVSNVWRLPLDGGPPQQVTHFTAGRIFSFAWSPDGKWLSLGSGVDRSDVVLISREP